MSIRRLRTFEARRKLASGTRTVAGFIVRIRKFLKAKETVMPKSVGFRTVITIAIAVVVVDFLLWDWFSSESNSSTLRNIGLLSAAIVALPAAIWRSIVAERQADTAQQEFLNGRYQKGAEMLGSHLTSVRLGGIFALRCLAEDHPDRYHVQIMRLFCAFVRHPTKDENVISPGDETNLAPRFEDLRGIPSAQREDVEAVMSAIACRRDTGLRLEEREGFQLDLRFADLRAASLDKANLGNANLFGVRFTNARLMNAKLSGADLRYADLSSSNPSATLGYQATTLHMANVVVANLTRMDGVDLSGGHLMGINLTGSILDGANLTDANLPGAKLAHARLWNADLSNAVLLEADLSNASFSDANLYGSTLSRSNLTGADFSGSKSGGSPVVGLTQTQLDTTCADPEDTPKLDGVVDAETGKPLVWRGNPVDNA